MFFFFGSNKTGKPTFLHKFRCVLSKFLFWGRDENNLENICETETKNSVYWLLTDLQGAFLYNTVCYSSLRFWPIFLYVYFSCHYVFWLYTVYEVYVINNNNPVISSSYVLRSSTESTYIILSSFFHKCLLTPWA